MRVLSPASTSPTSVRIRARVSDDYEKDEPEVSRITRRGTRAAYRSGRSRSRAHAPRIRRELRIADLIGRVIELRRLTDVMREQIIAIAWREIVGDQVASHTIPGTLSRGVLTVWTSHPVWTHELHFAKTTIVAQINAWVATRQVWLGTRPAVIELRSTVGAPRPRERVVDPDDLLRLQRRYRPCPRAAVAPLAPPTDAELAAITAETSVVEDPELREMIQSVRAMWNR